MRIRVHHQEEGSILTNKYLDPKKLKYFQQLVIEPMIGLWKLVSCLLFLELALGLFIISAVLPMPLETRIAVYSTQAGLLVIYHLDIVLNYRLSQFLIGSSIKISISETRLIVKKWRKKEWKRDMSINFGIKELIGKKEEPFISSMRLFLVFNNSRSHILASLYGLDDCQKLVETLNELLVQDRFQRDTDPMRR